MAVKSPYHVQAMAAGLPCIVSSIRGNVDLIVDGKGGYLFNPLDVMQVTSEIKRLILDERICKRMGVNNLNTIPKFDSYHVMKTMRAIYLNER